MSISVYAYNPGSEGARSLGFPIIRHENSKFKGKETKLVINWGASKIDNPEVHKCCILNSPEDVAVVANKLSFFRECKAKGLNYCLPSFFDDIEVAKNVVRDGEILVARTKLNGHSGEGIVIIDSIEKFVEAPLYTSYIKKKSEFRIHFFDKKIIFIQQKVRRKDHPEDKVNWQIRNHENGFNYAWKDVEVPNAVRRVAEDFIYNSDLLDFGAIDIIYNDRYQAACILEVNSAPGIEGETRERYLEAINEYWQNNFE